MLLGSTDHESIGILFDDRNAEKAITGVIQNTYYEGRIPVLEMWPMIEYIESKPAKSYLYLLSNMRKIVVIFIIHKLLFG